MEGRQGYAEIDRVVFDGRLDGVAFKYRILNCTQSMGSASEKVGCEGHYSKDSRQKSDHPISAKWKDVGHTPTLDCPALGRR